MFCFGLFGENPSYKKDERMKSHMYGDSIKQVNIFVGCRYDCVYCEKSFKAQMKRRKKYCIKCYNYEPHVHLNKLNSRFPKTKGDEFIWLCASSDITFAKKEVIEAILERVREMQDRTFLFQSKNPRCFMHYVFPSNVCLDTTIETNKDDLYTEGYLISKAPLPSQRYKDLLEVVHPRKFVTIEPILEFDMDVMVKWIKDIRPERVYIGYDSKKCYLPEPELSKSEELVKQLSKFTKAKIKKEWRRAWWEECNHRKA